MLGTFSQWKSIHKPTLFNIADASCLNLVEFNALHDLYLSTNGENWIWSDNEHIDGIRWDFSEPEANNPCRVHWYGLSCLFGCQQDGTGCFIFAIYLGNSNLTGTLPASLSNFTKLLFLDFGGNHLHGDLPVINSTVTLVNISHNAFAGPLKNFMSTAALPAVNLFYASNNFFTGPFPSFLLTLTVVEYLSLSGNAFTGTIPDKISQLSNLSYLSLGTNQFNGSIPSSICQLHYLQVLYLYNNSFTGPLPLCDWPHLEYFWLSDNSFSGDFSTNLCRSPDVAYISVYNNQLAGSLPDCLQNLGRLRTFQVQNNQLEGSLQEVFNSTSQVCLQHVDLSDNSFTGEFPSELFLMPALESVAAVKNCFQGTLPLSICNAGINLTVIALDGMRASKNCLRYLWDPLDVSVGYFSYLMHGSIPDCVWTLPNLSVLHFSGNGFEGTLPRNLSLNSSRLLDVALNHNILYGTIPAEIQSVAYVNFDMSYNKLYGSIDALDNMPFVFSRDSKNVEPTQQYGSNAQLRLDQNRLSGKLPLLFKNAEDVNILNGNLFACDDKSLPAHDPQFGNYICGSQEYDRSLIVFGCLIGSLVGLVLIMSFGLLAKTCCEVVVSKLSQWFHALHYATFFIFSLSRFETVLRTEDPFLDFFTATGRCNNSNISRALQQWSEMEAVAGRYFDVDSLRRIPNVFKFLSVLTFMRRISVMVAVIALVTCLPTYMILYTINPNNYTEYSTHEQRYGWITTVTFLRGILPAAILFSLWLLILVVVFAKIVWHFNLHEHDESWLMKLWSNCSTWLFPMGEMEDSLLVIEQDMGSSSPNSFDQKPVKTNSSKKFIEQQDETDSSSTIDDSDSQNINEQLYFWTVYALIVIVNMVVCVTINILYLTNQNDTYTTSEGKIAMQFAMAGFKIIWGMMMIRTMINFLSFNRHSVMLHVMMLLFNGIIAPCVATAFSDQSCFKDFFDGGSSINASYSIPVCQSFFQDFSVQTLSVFTACEQFQMTTFTTTYTPGFIYYYSCRSKLLSLYIPVYFYIYSMLLVGVPAMLCLQAQACQINWFPRSVIERTVKLILRPQDCLISNSTVLGHMIIRGDSILVMVINHLVVLMTFGLMSPILAVVVALSIVVNTLAWQITIIRFFKSADRAAPFFIVPAVVQEAPSESTECPDSTFAHNNNSTQFHGEDESKLQLLNKSIGHTWICPKNAKWLIFYCSIWFFGLMIFDMVGDQRGWKAAVGAIVIVAGLMLVLRWLLLDTVQFLFRKWTNHTQNSRHSILSDWSIGTVS
jgi:hypothetical protein